MFLTFDTSHFEMSPRNLFAEENKRFISVTLDTSHFPIGPCGPLEQKPLGGSLRHESTALWSSTLDCGENAGVMCDGFMFLVEVLGEGDGWK